MKRRLHVHIKLVLLLPTSMAGSLVMVSTLLYEEFQDVFPEKLPKGVPSDRGTAHRVDLVPGASPSNIPPYNLGPKELDELKTQLQEMLDQGWIRPSSSPYASPVLFVSKKKGNGGCA